MDFGTINFILWSALMIYLIMQVNRFSNKLNPYDFFSTKEKETYDSSKKKTKKVLI